MRVLLVTNLYPSRRQPTRGTFNLNGFTALSRHCELRVLAPLPWWSRVRHPREILRTPAEADTGIPALFPTYWSIPRAPQFHGYGVFASLLPHARRIHKSFPFDIILAAWAYPDAVAAAHLANYFNCPLVSMVLGSDVNELAHNANLRRQITWALQQSAEVIAVSRALQARVMELGLPAERILVQHNGVDGERFQPRDRLEARAELGLPAGGRLICCVGNLAPEKGTDILIEAMGALKGEDAADVRLAVVGDGPLRPVLNQRAAELNIADRVQFVGRRPYPEIPRWMAAADLLCLPSRREGCPNVVLEALASGRPVVATRVGGVPELLSPSTGVLVPPEDPQAMAAGIRAVLGGTWDPDALRASVPCLSWNEFSITIRDALARALAQGEGRADTAHLISGDGAPPRNGAHGEPDPAAAEVGSLASRVPYGAGKM